MFFFETGNKRDFKCLEGRVGGLCFRGELFLVFNLGGGKGWGRAVQLLFYGEGLKALFRGWS